MSRLIHSGAAWTSTSQLQKESCRPRPWMEDAVLCPLCTYDLRGLTVPRCPECGYQFDWAELLDRSRHQHPYLFEHYPKSNSWSFVRTAVGGLDTFSFWAQLRPEMTPQAKRLLIYWLFCTTLPFLLAGALMGVHAIRHSDFISDEGMFIRPIFLAGYCLISWTTVTFCTLMIFRQTMARAHILPIHVARCVGYSFDIGVWFFVGAVAVVLCQWWSQNKGADIPDSLLGIMFALLMFVAAGRLFMAYRLYLQFRHAFWVVLSTQIIAAILTMVCLLHLDMVV